MTRAWYGISSTGGQAGAVIIKLIGMAGPENQDAIKTLEKDRFVDDLFGDETREGVDIQVRGTTNILGRGGFSLKFVSTVELNPVIKLTLKEKLSRCLGTSVILNLIYYLRV